MYLKLTLVTVSTQKNYVKCVQTQIHIYTDLSFPFYHTMELLYNIKLKNYYKYYTLYILYFINE